MKHLIRSLVALLFFAAPLCAEYEGDFAPGSTVAFQFNTTTAFGVPSTFSSATLTVYKDSGTTQDGGDITLSTDFDSVTGLNNVSINTATDKTFYTSGANFSVVVLTGTVDGTSVVGTEVGNFSLSHRYAPFVMHTTTIATLASQTSFTLTTGSADNDAYNKGFAIIVDATTATQKAIAPIADYVGSTRTVTLDVDPAVFTMAANDYISIVADPLSDTVASVSAANVDKDHTWRFDNRSQITAANDIKESVGSTGYLIAMDFSEPMPVLSSIQSVSSVTVTDVVGETEPTITASAASTDKRKVNITVNGASATDATYTFTVTIVTTDSQTFVRKGRLVIQ